MSPKNLNKLKESKEKNNSMNKEYYISVKVSKENLNKIIRYIKQDYYREEKKITKEEINQYTNIALEEFFEMYYDIVGGG